jgi:glycosyltransferase involved in cell wall biosynthesis
MPLYYKDNPKWFKYSMNSILEQTLAPSEIVIVVDGPLTSELNSILEEYKGKYKDLFVIKRFKENVGLGIALKKGVEICSNEFIARMDADDYAIPERCEKQLAIFEEHPEYDVVGSNVSEFVDSIDNVVSSVVLPEFPDDVVKYAKKRCPVRHPTLIYRKSAVIKAGNYRDYRHAQDYNLMVHMILNGSKIYNIQENLVYMRVSKDFYKRRGGWKQMKLILKLKKEFYEVGFYSKKDFVISAFGNAIICILPNNIRRLFYKKVLRK